MTRSRAALAVFACLAFAAAATWPTHAFAHGPRDYVVTDYHYYWIGPFRQAMPVVQHTYYCDGDYEVTTPPPGSVGYAFSVTNVMDECG